MTTDQQNAFAQGGGGGLFAAPYLLETIIVVSVGILTLYTAWIIFKAYAEYGRGDLKSGEMMALWVRAIFMLMLGSWLFVH